MSDDGRRIVGIVYGYCPMGCGQTLQVDGLGTVSCYASQCPRPDALAVILANPETEHLVQVGLTSYTVQHPLKERVESMLFSCPVHVYVSDTVHLHIGTPGLYRVSLPEQDGRPWVGGRWELIGDADG